MSTLELRRLRKVFPDGTVAVDNVDISIADGEFLAIVGPSGCGKTTVLRMVAGLEDATSGAILIDGVRVNDLSAQQRDIAMAFQQHALYPHMTVEENLGFPLRMARVHHDEVASRVRSIAEVLGLTGLLDETPRRLSGGQQQRVSMGRAIIRNPRLFLMDEPMSNLDAKMRTSARAEIMRIQRRLGATTMYVTHDQVEAMSMAARVVIMRAGRIVQMGTPLDLYRRPVDVFVGQFIGSPPMSIVPTRIVEVDGVATMRIGPFDVPLPAGHPVGKMIGRSLALGVRPEALRRSDDGPLLASVSFTEQLGSEQLVHADLDCPGIESVGSQTVNDTGTHAEIRFYVDAQDEISLWQPLQLDIDVRELHFFSLADGRRIDLPVQPPERVKSPSRSATQAGASAARPS